MGSVRWRITLISTMLVALVLAGAAALILRAVEAELEERAETALEEAETAIDEAEATIVLGGEEFTLGIFEGDEDDDGEVYAELIGEDGERSFVLAIEPETDELLEVFDEDGDEVLDGDFYEALEETIFRVELAEGETYFVVADELDEVRESLDALRDVLWVAVPLLTGLFSVLTYVLVGRALKPVHAITDQVASISSSELDRRVPVPDSNDEISELATVMNSMLGRLEAGARRQREFSADASHELRSPLTAIRAAAEMIGRRSDDDRVGGLADDVVDEADRMDELIGDLLTLARSEEAVLVDPQPIALAALAAEVVDAVDSPIVELVVEDADTSRAQDTVMGDEGQVRRVFQNLVDNALRYAESRVLVRVAAGTFHVEDDGPGIPADQRDDVFERFSRVDHSRARTSGGTGLGLALVKAIVDRHGATVRIDDSPELGGARVTVAFASRSPEANGFGPAGQL